ncbi:hypothetical protein D3C81_2147810 [compost metagenome]
MSHNWNAGPYAGFHSSGNFSSTFHFDTLAQAFTHDAANIAHGFIYAAVIG